MNYCFQISIDNIEQGTDIYMFIRKLYLTYHFCDSTDEDKWNVKSTSTFIPKFIKETIFKKLDRKKKLMQKELQITYLTWEKDLIHIDQMKL